MTKYMLSLKFFSKLALGSEKNTVALLGYNFTGKIDMTEEV